MTWFASWFDSPYYHLLYQNRDDKEAQFFMQNLLNYLQLPKQSRILDLACGKGRHSIFLHQQGYQVLGVDLSPQSIEAAQTAAAAGLSFAVHDMRESLDAGDFDAVFNLFTSFGYFESDEEHLKTLEQARKLLLKSKGVFVIDFFNAHKVITNLVFEEEKRVGGILFKIERALINGYIVKDIRFQDQGTDYHFQEKVRAFQLSDFEKLLETVGFSIEARFGNFALEPYDLIHSDRLILVARPC